MDTSSIDSFQKGTKDVLVQCRDVLTVLLSDYPEYFCVDIIIKPTNNVKIYLDGDKGISIERCVFFNRKIYGLIEEHGIFGSDDFSLEVSSPGTDKPLKDQRQYLQHIGRTLSVSMTTGAVIKGKLVAVHEKKDIQIEVQEGKGKKMTHIIVDLQWADIVHAIVETPF
ncbi:MAG: hypothetical protein QM528_08130 [Phycisphaerales bacterium]|nr:hypothetical protein [Phycisphaerales bacterium]